MFVYKQYAGRIHLFTFLHYFVPHTVIEVIVSIALRHGTRDCFLRYLLGTKETRGYLEKYGFDSAGA